MFVESPQFVMYYLAEASRDIYTLSRRKIMSNKKYLSAEIGGWALGGATAYTSMTLLKEVIVNEDLRIITSLAVKSGGWILGNVGTFKLVELFQNESEYVKQRDLSKANLTGVGLAFISKYLLSKGMISENVSPENAVLISSLIGGVIPTLVRHCINNKTQVLNRVKLEDKI